VFIHRRILTGHVVLSCVKRRMHKRTVVFAVAYLDRMAPMTRFECAPFNFKFRYRHHSCEARTIEKTNVSKEKMYV